MSHVYESGAAPRAYADRCNAIEAKQCEVSQIIAGQWFPSKVRVNEAQSAKTPGCAAQSTNIGQEQSRSIADHDVLDHTPASDQRADLAMDLEGDFTQECGELVRNDLVGSQTPTKNTL